MELSFANQAYLRIFFSRCTIVARFGLFEDVKITGMISDSRVTNVKIRFVVDSGV